jgi:hypothetical protein
MIMNKIEYIYLNRKAFLAAIISAAFPLGVNAAAGKVEFASGGASVKSIDGSIKILVKGMDINAGDTILTESGRAQVKFTDGGYMSFQPNTQFKVEDYQFDGKQDGTEKGFYSLIKGGLRAVTGLVGKQNKTNYRVATPVATIGIRGTYFLAEFREKLRTHVGQGSIYVFNDQGDIILFEGQSAEVEAGGIPKYTDEELTLGARGPNGAEPESGNNQQLVEDENSNLFKVSEQYSDAGLSCGLTGGCDISAVMANLNGTGASATYVLDPSVANIGGGGSWTSEVRSGTYLIAQFGSYSMSGTMNMSLTDNGNSSPFVYSDSFSVSGSILPSGTFGLTGNTSTSGICGSNCTINVIGIFSGSQAEKASIGYVIKGTPIGVQITGSAGVVVEPQAQ